MLDWHGDPLGDQTYYFTAARCASDFDKRVVAIGTSPRGSRIWVGSSRTWDEFVKPVTAILKHLEATTKPVDAPIPVVAVSSNDTSKIADAFDVGIIPPELLSDEANERAREEMEEWAYYSHFRILKKSNADFTAEVTLKGTLLGTVEFQMDLADPENVKWRYAISRFFLGELQRVRRNEGKAKRSRPSSYRRRRFAFLLGEELLAS